jgi:hypothetical protein
MALIQGGEYSKIGTEPNAKYFNASIGATPVTARPRWHVALLVRMTVPASGALYGMETWQ